MGTNHKRLCKINPLLDHKISALPNLTRSCVIFEILTVFAAKRLDIRIEEHLAARTPLSAMNKTTSRLLWTSLDSL